MKIPTPEQMRKEFWKLSAKRDEMQKELEPVRAARDKVVARHAKELEPHEIKIRKLSEPLFEVEQQIGFLVRACAGKMGEPE